VDFLDVDLDELEDVAASDCPNQPVVAFGHVQDADQYWVVQCRIVLLLLEGDLL
jgi:hypothetical protein